MDGIVRVGAVNCQDDYMLCRQQNIQSYPTLLFYGSAGTLRFQGPKELDELVQFVVDNLDDQIFRLRQANFEKVVFGEKQGADSNLPWVILFCARDEFSCPEASHRNLLAHMLDGLVNFGVMDCDANKKMCEEYAVDGNGGYFFTSQKTVKEKKGKRLKNSEFKDMAEEIFDELPEVTDLDDEKYSKFRLRLEDELGPPWLVHFVFGDDGKSVNEKKIPPLIPRLKYGRYDCKKYPEDCR